MALLDLSKYPPPPGQQRSYPKPSKTGKVQFAIPGYTLQGETYYEIYGDLESGRVPLICLHGGPGVPHSYFFPISLISKDYGVPVIMYDQIGCGGSTRFPDRMGDTAFWTPQLFMAEIDNLKQVLGIQHFDLLGQSWGGMLAGQYAATTQPAGLRKLIIADSPASMETWMKVANQLRSGLPESVQEVLNRCEKEGKTDTDEYEAAVTEFYKRHLCRLEAFPTELTDAFSELAKDNTVYMTMNGPNEFYITGSLKTWNIVEELKSITPETVPGGVLLMNGYFDEAQDECMLPYFQHISAKVKWVQFSLSAHVPQLEEAEKFLQTLGGFLQS